MSRENQIDQFYDECFSLLSELILLNNKPLPLNPLKDAITINKALLKLPFQRHDTRVDLNYDIMKFYKTYLEEGKATLEKIPTVYTIPRSKIVYEDWDLWYREVVWYGNKKGAYLYGNWETVYQLSGHH
jgi:hypothetical protein